MKLTALWLIVISPLLLQIMRQHVVRRKVKAREAITGLPLCQIGEIALYPLQKLFRRPGKDLIFFPNHYKSGIQTGG